MRFKYEIIVFFILGDTIRSG